VPRRAGPSAFDPASDDPRHQEFARHIVRYAERRPIRQAGLARLDYIGDAGAPPGGYRMEMIHLPPGVGCAANGRAVEDAYFVLWRRPDDWSEKTDDAARRRQSRF